MPGLRSALRSWDLKDCYSQNPQLLKLAYGAGHCKKIKGKIRYYNIFEAGDQIDHARVNPVWL
jgi:hypothetical protein